MDVFAISDIRGLIPEQRRILAEHWRRRAIAQSVVLLPGGVGVEDLEWLEELPGSIVVAPRPGEDVEGLLAASASLADVHVVVDEALRFPGFKRTSGQQEKGLVVAACASGAEWERTREVCERAREDDKDALVILAGGPPFHIDRSDEQARRLLDAAVDACVYGGVAESDWSRCYQGKFGKKGTWTGTDYRLVDAYFLDGVLTYIGDVDHAGWLRKERERQALTTFSWVHESNAASRPCPPLSIVRAPARSEALYSLPAPEPKVEKKQSKPTAIGRPPGVKDTASANGHAEYKRWLTYLVRDVDTDRSVEDFCRKWPGVADWYADYFALHAPEAILSDVAKLEEASPSWPPAADGDGWRTYLSKTTQSLTLGSVESIYPDDWERWKPFWCSYSRDLTVSDVMKLEETSPTSSEDLAPVDAGATSETSGTAEWTRTETAHIRRLCEAYPDVTVTTVMGMRNGSPESELLLRAAQRTGAWTTGSLLAAVVGGGVDAAADAPADASLSFSDALESLPQDESLATVRATRPRWWAKWGERCSIFESTATVGAITALVDAEADFDWTEVAVLFGASVTIGEMRAHFPDIGDEFPASLVYRDAATVGEAARDFETRADVGASASSPSTSARASTDPDWDEIVARVVDVDDSLSMDSFEAELVDAVMRPLVDATVSR